MEIDKIPEFRAHFDEVVKELISKEQTKPKLHVSDIIDFRDIFGAERQGLPKFYRILKQFAPFGPDNMHPVFVSKHLKAVGEVRLLKEAHLKCVVKQEEYPDIQMEAHCF